MTYINTVALTKLAEMMGAEVSAYVPVATVTLGHFTYYLRSESSDPFALVAAMKAEMAKRGFCLVICHNEMWYEVDRCSNHPFDPTDPNSTLNAEVSAMTEIMEREKWANSGSVTKRFMKKVNSTVTAFLK